jgi:hypothetical protein
MGLLAFASCLPAVVPFLFSLAFLSGTAPLLFSAAARRWERGVKLTLSLSNCFAAGVLFSGSIVHLLSESQEKLSAVCSYPVAPVMCAAGFFFVLIVEDAVVGLSTRNGEIGDAAASPRTMKELAPRASLGPAAALRERRSRSVGGVAEDVDRGRGLSVASNSSEPVDLMDEDDTESLLSVGSSGGMCTEAKGACAFPLRR